MRNKYVPEQNPSSIEELKENHRRENYTSHSKTNEPSQYILYQMSHATHQDIDPNACKSHKADKLAVLGAEEIYHISVPSFPHYPKHYKRINFQ